MPLPVVHSHDDQLAGALSTPGGSGNFKKHNRLPPDLQIAKVMVEMTSHNPIQINFASKLSGQSFWQPFAAP
jgi:hypothetical protein